MSRPWYVEELMNLLVEVACARPSGNGDLLGKAEVCLRIGGTIERTDEIVISRGANALPCPGRDQQRPGVSP